MAKSQGTFHIQYSDDFEQPSSRPASSVRFSEEIITYEDSYASDSDSDASKSKFSYIETEIREPQDEDDITTSRTEMTETFEVPSVSDKTERKYSVPAEDISFDDESSVWSSDTRSYTSVTGSESSFVTAADSLEGWEDSYSADFTPPSTTNRSQGFSTTDFKTFSYADSQTDESSGTTTFIDENDLRQKFIAKCFNNLKLNQLEKNTQSLEEEFQKKVTLNKRSEVDALNSFCCSRIEQLKTSSKDPKMLNARSTREKVTGVYFTDLARDYGVSDHLMNGLLLRNTQGNLQKIADMDVHMVDKCPKCRKQVEKMAEVDFIKRAKAIVSEKLINEKVEWNSIWSHDQICLQGEALRGLPTFRNCSSSEILEKWKDSILVKKRNMEEVNEGD